MRSVILILLFFLFRLSLQAQNTDSVNYYFAGFQSHYGFIIPHTEAIRPVSHTNPYGFDVSLNKLKTSYESWTVFNHYNISGIQMSYINFQNPDILGSAFILSAFTEPIMVYSDKFLFSIKGGIGITYQTRIYEYEKNELNKFFSTRISFTGYLSARFKYRIGTKTYLTLSGNYNHISNGAMRIPNYGMNFPTVSLGIEHFLKPVPELNSVYVPRSDKKASGQYLIVQSLTGFKVVYGTDTWTFGLSARYARQLRTYYALNAGAEFIADKGVKKMIGIENLDLDYKRFAITAGQDFLLGKVVFTQYLGLYLYSPYKAKQPVYQKYELSYMIIPRFLIGVYLKAHTSEAELFGFSANYMLKIK